MVTQKKKKQQSIRKKLSCHKLSAAHIKACEIASLAKKETMETLNVKLQAQQYTTQHAAYFELLINLQN
jgi:hypothetical protein